MSRVPNDSRVVRRNLPLHLLALAGAVLLIPAVAACGTSGDSSVSTPGTSAAASTEASPTAEASGTAGASAPAGTSGASAVANAVANCATSGIKAHITIKPQEQFTGTVTATLAITNTSKRPCRVSGWATVTLLNPADEPVKVPTTKVNQPSAPVAVDLAPGATASAGMKWIHCEKSDDACPVGSGLSVSVAGDTKTVYASLTNFPAPETCNITMESLRIGTLQPSGKDVVSW